MGSVFELRSTGRPQKHLDRVTLRSVGEQAGQHRGAERPWGKPADPETLRDVIRMHQGLVDSQRCKAAWVSRPPVPCASVVSGRGQRAAQKLSGGAGRLEHVTRRSVGLDDEIERQVGTPRLGRYLCRIGEKVMCDMGRCRPAVPLQRPSRPLPVSRLVRPEYSHHLGHGLFDVSAVHRAHAKDAFQVRPLSARSMLRRSSTCGIVSAKGLRCYNVPLGRLDQDPVRTPFNTVHRPSQPGTPVTAGPGPGGVRPGRRAVSRREQVLRRRSGDSCEQVGVFAFAVERCE